MADFDIVRRCISKYPAKVQYIQQIVCIYDTNGISSQSLHKYWKEHIRITKQLGYGKMVKVFIHLMPRLFWSLLKGWFL